jgi:hypothetical protein
MAELVLPSSVDFSKRLPALPEGVSSQLLSLQATNGTGPFTPGQVIQFDLPSRQNLYLDGKTMFIRYKITYTSAATAGIVRRKPVFTAFQKLDEFCGSTPINSVYNYHTVANLWVDSNMSVADIYGQQYAFGTTPQTATPTMDQFDSYTLPTTGGDNVLYLAAPVVCSAIASADHLIPTGLMPPLRLQFTIASIADQAQVSTNITAISISNPELCIQSIDMPNVDNIVAMSAPKLFLKMNAWANASNSLASGATGFQTFIYNHRYESIENLFLVCAAADATKGVNGPLESFDITGTNGGTVQFQIGQNLYPQMPINTAIGGGKASILQYLRETVGSIVDQRNSMSINAVEFGRLASGATASTGVEPAKCYFSVPLSKIQSSNPYQAVTLLSGVSAASTPISVLVSIGSATNSIMNIQLVAQYTELLEIDPMTKSVRVIQ